MNMNLCFIYTIMYLTLFMKLDLPTFGKLKSMTHLLKFHKYLVWIFFSFLISTCIYHIRRDLEKHLPVKFNAKALCIKKFLCTLYMYSNKVLALKFKHRYLSAELWLTHRLVEFLCLGLLMEVLPHAVELHVSRNKMIINRNKRIANKQSFKCDHCKQRMTHMSSFLPLFTSIIYVSCNFSVW